MGLGGEGRRRGSRWRKQEAGGAADRRWSSLSCRSSRRAGDGRVGEMGEGRGVCGVGGRWERERERRKGKGV
jgi:hypothetical protein